MKVPLIIFSVVALIAVSGFFLYSNGQKSREIPDPPASEIVSTDTEQTAVFAGGCFWGIEAVYEALNGVYDAVPGYSGGEKATAHYDKVSSGGTNHAESVLVTYDPGKINYGTLLKVFFSVAHNPTQLNYQGPDHGRQYRSVVFYANQEQKRIAEEYILILEDQKVFNKPIVTEVVPLEGFYPAEDYHQNFMKQNPTHPYIVYWDVPKLEHLKEEFPDLIEPE
jgi:peptide-methionine (S)-S-oxide reductase